MSKAKRARPDLEWPWCDVCQANVREVNGAKHVCDPAWNAEAPRQLPLFGGLI